MILTFSEVQAFVFQKSERLKEEAAATEAEIASLFTPYKEVNPRTFGYRHFAKAPKATPFTITLEFPVPARVDTIILVPVTSLDPQHQEQVFGFPKRFTLELITEDSTPLTVADYRAADYQTVGNGPQIFSVPTPGDFRKLQITVFEHAHQDFKIWDRVFALSEIYAFQGEQNMALDSTVDISVRSPISYYWNPQALVNGITTQAPIDQSTDNFEGFYARYARVRILFDLGETRTIDELRLWPGDDEQSLDSSFAGGSAFPKTVKLYALDSLDSRDYRSLLSVQAELPTQVGMNPLSIRLGPTSSRYFLLDLGSPVLLHNRSSIMLSEVELVGNGQIHSRGTKPFLHSYAERNTDDTLIINTDSSTLKRRLLRLTDGLSVVGQILPQKQWLIDSARLNLLENRLSSLQRELIIAQVKDQQNLRWIFVLAAALIVIMIMALFLLSLTARQKMYHLKQRFANDLHDEIGANINSVSQHIEMALELLHQKKDGFEKMLNNALDVCRLTSEETRNLNEFFGDRRQDISFTERIQQTASIILRETQCHFKFDEIQWFDQLDVMRKWDLILFVKEALNNVAKHARASEVWIHTFRENGTVSMVIRDNGKGIPQSEIPPEQLQRRSAVLKGDLSVINEIDGGTSVELKFRMKRR